MSTKSQHYIELNTTNTSNSESSNENNLNENLNENADENTDENNDNTDNIPMPATPQFSSNLDTELNQPPAISSLEVCDKCPHMSIVVNSETAMCAAVVCYTCCIAAITAAIAAVILFIIAMFKDSSNNSGGHRHFHGGFGGCNYYPMLLYYNIDPIILRNKPKVSFARENDVNVCCCQMEVPHYYKIECKNCGEILKSGYKRGSLILSIVLGVIFLSLFGGLIYLIVRGRS